MHPAFSPGTAGMTYLGKPCVPAGMHCVCITAQVPAVLRVVHDHTEASWANDLGGQWAGENQSDPVLEEIEDQGGSFSIMQGSAASKWALEPEAI